MWTFFFALFVASFPTIGLAEMDICQARYQALAPVSDYSGGVTYIDRGKGKYTYSRSNTSYSSRFYQLNVPTSRGSHRIDLVIPDFETMELNYDFSTEDLRDSVMRAVNKLPANRIESTKTIRVDFNPAKDDAAFMEEIEQGHIAGEAGTGDGSIDFFPASFDDFVKDVEGGVGLLEHEHGHNVAKAAFGTTAPPASYVRAAQLDGAVSDYAQKNIELGKGYDEDFADGLMEYLNYIRGERGDLSGIENRAAWFDDFFGVTRLANGQPQYTEGTVMRLNQLARNPGEPIDISKYRKVINGAYYSLIGGGAGYILYNIGKNNMPAQNGAPAH
jgi:hypothetical protein